MNRKVCEKCRRYGGYLDGNSRAWSCAELIWSEHSEVIPEHSFLNRDQFHPMTEERINPPEWCERPLEQVILSSSEDVDIKKDSAVVYDGNSYAEHRAEQIRNVGLRDKSGMFCSTAPAGSFKSIQVKRRAGDSVTW